MPRKNRGYKRGEPFKDSRLFIIACEGDKRERQYFEEIQKKSRRIKIKVLRAEQGEEGKSAPNWVLERAAAFCKEYDLKEDDFLWFVIDKDKWSEKILREINDKCEKNDNWDIAISNPCFEVWLYMHMQDISKTASKTCAEFKAELHKLTKGGYNAAEYLHNLKEATARAKKSDSDPNFFIPNERETRLYRLAEQLLGFLGTDI